MDDIVRNTKAEVQRLKYDKDGCLMLVASDFYLFLRKPEGLFNPSRGILIPESRSNDLGGFCMNETKKLYRLDNGVLAGVCGGVAEYFNVDANVVRLIWVALCFAGTAGFWLYVAAALLLPKKSQVYPGY